MDENKRKKWQFRKSLFRQIVLWVLVFLVLALLISQIVWYERRKSDARDALRDAKNVELALRLLSVRSYKLSEPLYDMSETSGLNETYRDEVETYSGVEDGYTIDSWNTENNRVESFTYTTGKITVYYTYDFESDTADWRAEYNLTLVGDGETDD